MGLEKMQDLELLACVYVCTESEGQERVFFFDKGLFSVQRRIILC